MKPPVKPGRIRLIIRRLAAIGPVISRRPGRLPRSRFGRLALAAGLILIVLALAGIIYRALSGNDQPEPGAGSNLYADPHCQGPVLNQSPECLHGLVYWKMDYVNRWRNKRHNCWVVINGYIYEITSYPPLAGLDEPIYDLCGHDASVRFEQLGLPRPDNSYLKGRVDPGQ